MATNVIGRSILRVFINNSNKICMSSTLSKLRHTKPSIAQQSSFAPTVSVIQRRDLSLTSALRGASADDIDDNDTEGDETSASAGTHRQTVDLETSKLYMKSQAYKTTYGDKLVWQPYRRNFKGQIPPQKTRKQCIRGGVIATGNPCPICRDEYLVVSSENMDLLKQFVSPQTGQLLSYQKTGVCQQQHRKLQIALLQAWDQGLLEMPLPHKHYDYSDYYEFKPRPHKESVKQPQ